MAQKDPKNYLITELQLGALQNYVSAGPWVEVHPLMVILHNLPETKVAAAKPPKGLQRIDPDPPGNGTPSDRDLP